MKRLIYVVLILIISFSFIGCSVTPAPYKKLGVKISDSPKTISGYSDFNITENKYKVIYRGGFYYTFNTESEVMQNAYKRAKELCKENNFNKYVFSNEILTKENSPSLYYTYRLDVTCKN